LEREGWSYALGPFRRSGIVTPQPIPPKDIRGDLVGDPAGYGLRIATIAIVIHHTASPPEVDWPAIASYHVNTNGWVGIAYHLGIDPDGRVNILGDLDSKRAHIAGRNHELVSVCLRGNFTAAPPPEAQLAGTRQAIALLRDKYGAILLLGHKDAALPTDPTACPGDTWEQWHGDV
jgi:hypothetical protein